jgi:hypothetical protein
MRNLLVGIAAGLLVGAVPIGADTPEKNLPERPRAATLSTVVQPGETVRWRSPTIGAVNRLRLYIGGRPAAYGVEPRTNNCVAYGYEAGVAVRLTDCVKGRRVRYVRVRAVSAALKPVAVRLRLN